MDKKTLQNLLQQQRINVKKSLGQNFLINPISIQRIISSIKDLNPQTLIEVGPGLGSLTHSLISLGIPLTLVELDHKIYNYWKDKKVNIVLSDALKLEPSFFQAPCTLVGNLPYNIASSVVVESCKGWDGVETMVLMLQKEVGQRILSSCGTKIFGFLSVISQVHWNMHFLFKIPSSDFFPVPKVDGMVIQFRRKKKADLDNALFIQFVKECFVQKRKFLLTKLKKQKGTKVLNIFNELGIDLKVRAEDLSPQQYIDLYKKLF